MKKYILIICYLLLLSINVNAQDIYGTGRNEDTLYLDPDDFTVGQVIAVDTLNGEKVFVGKDSVTGVSQSSTNYYYWRAKLTQNQLLSSGRLTYEPIDYTDGDRDRYITVADSVTLLSTKVDTGVYKIQFRTGGQNTFRGEITNSSGYYYAFERSVYPLYGHNVYDEENEVDVWTEELYGYLVFPSMPVYGDFSYQQGALYARTFDANWVPSDNILKDGVPVELKVWIKP